MSRLTDKIKDSIPKTIFFDQSLFNFFLFFSFSSLYKFDSVM